MIKNESKTEKEKEDQSLLDSISNKENKSIKNIDNYKLTNDENKNIINDINNLKYNKNNNHIPLSNSTTFTSKEKEKEKPTMELNPEKQVKCKPFFSAFSPKNIIKNYSHNINVSSFSLINKSNTPKNIIQNSILFHNKNKNFFSFSSLLNKNNSYKNISKNIDLNDKNFEKNKKIKNDLILLKNSKGNEDKKDIMNINDSVNNNKKFEKIKIKKNDIIDDNNKESNDYEKEKEKDNLIKKNKNKIPFNTTIFKKIIEEVKGEKNYIEKVVHRKIMHQRELFRNSLIKDNIKKYDTNTYKEITTKKIKNPFNFYLSKNPKEIHETRNYSTKRDLAENKMNNSYTNLTNMTNINKRNSIKIKKIPLNKLKHKVKTNNPKSNYYYNNDITTPNINDINNNIYKSQKIILNKNNKNIDTRYSFSFNDNNNIINNSSYGNNYPRITEIPDKNNYLSFSNLNLDKSNLDSGNKKILYNKVNVKKKKYNLMNNNNNHIKINLNKNLNKNNNYNVYPTEIDIDFQDKKIGLFKKKINNISLGKNNNNTYQNENRYNNFSYNNSNIYNKKINNTIFKSYISNNQNKYLNSNTNMNMNESYRINNYQNLTSYTYKGNNNLINASESPSVLTYNSKKVKQINYQNLRDDFYTNEYQTNRTILKEEIKLEQIITLLNFEDLLIIEDKLNLILNILKSDKNTSNEFFDLFNYFFSSSLKSKFEQIYKYFLIESEAIKIFINHSLILIMICYDFASNDNNINNNIKFSLYESIRLIYINLLMIISPIKNKIKYENKDYYNLRLIEMSGINKIIKKNLINYNITNDNIDDISFNRELLHNNSILLLKNISLIIKNYKNEIISELYNSIKINLLSLDDINIYFRQNILREDFIGCSILGSTFLKEKKNFATPSIPYVPRRSGKKYTLILDLDETLIHFKVNKNFSDEGVLKLRPGVGTFLEIIKEYYEIILFTEASEAYTELIMEAFNKNEFFEYKLYRQHTIIIGEDFVKDLQRIGRPLDSIIIVDNFAQNFRMQKNNGILIKPFYGEDQNDQALIDLIPILINIAKDNIDTRNGLVKYRDEIVTKITSNLFRRNNDKN